MESQEKKGYQSRDNQQRPNDLKQNESRTRIESWHRERKEEHEGESECRVSKAVLAKFGHRTNQKVKRQSNARHFLARIKDFWKQLLQKY
jgi:hypothetical protein